MNEKIVKKTQDTLGKIIKKPPLGDKLLNKPPFRFLHDLIMSVIKTTGFMKGLYTDKESHSDNVKDRDTKIAFLQKAISMVSLVIGKDLSVRPSKVVAGHDPEKTNEFLQAMAAAINKKVDNDEFVQRVLNSDGKPPKEKKSEKKDKEDKKDRDEKREKSSDRRKRDSESSLPRTSTDRPSGKLEGRQKLSTSKIPHPAAKSAASTKQTPLKASTSRSSARDGSYVKPPVTKFSAKPPGPKPPVSKLPGSKLPGSKPPGFHAQTSQRKTLTASLKKKEEDREERRSRHKEDGERSRERSGRRERSHDRKDESKEEERERRREKRKKEKEAEEANKEEDAPPRIPRPTSAKGARRRHREATDSTGSGDEDSRPPVTMDAPSEPPVSNGHVEEEAPAPTNNRRMRPSSARPAAPRIKKNEPPPVEHISTGNVPNVIIDKGGKSDSDSDDDGFMAKDEEIEPVQNTHQDAGLDDDDGEHGGLVKKILETKKELEDGQGTQKKTQIERSPVNDAARRKERERTQREIDTLRQNIQTLTRSVLPLAKVLDFVQEDLDQMQKELDTWKREHRQNRTALRQEYDVTENLIEPLRAQLLELDQMIGDKHDQIGAVKANLLRNDEKINKMLGSVANTT